jgi:hypothetical protein
MKRLIKNSSLNLKQLKINDIIKVTWKYDMIDIGKIFKITHINGKLTIYYKLREGGTAVFSEDDIEELKIINVEVLEE